jgi:shikimate kinase
MIINLLGPPASFKTTFAEYFIQQHPEFTHCAIDKYRIIFKDEDRVWKELDKTSNYISKVIIETSGLSHRHKDIINNLQNKNNLKTILLYANYDILVKRLKNRQKLNNEYNKDEFDFLQYAFERIDYLKKIADISINTTNLSVLDIYNKVIKELGV